MSTLSFHADTDSDADELLATSTAATVATTMKAVVPSAAKKNEKNKMEMKNENGQ